MRQRIAALVGVRDDLDVLPLCIANFLRLGFDHIAVVAIAPSEAARDTINDLATHPRVAAHFYDALDPNGDFLRTAGALMQDLLEVFHPDWFLACDADEFLVLRQPDIHDVPGLTLDGPIRVNRYNYAWRADLPPDRILAEMNDPAQAAVYADRKLVWEDGKLIEGMRWSQHTIGPKVMMRPDRIEALGVGFHSARGADGAPQKLASTDDMLMVHLPFTSFARFEKKVRNARDQLGALSGLHEGQASLHWKTWVQSLEAGTLQQTFDREALQGAEFSAMVASGAIRTARELLDVC